MKSTRIYILFVLCLFATLSTNAQKKNKIKKESKKTIVADSLKSPVIIDSVAAGYIDYGTFKLPPLSVLYENARSNPSITVLEKEKQLQKLLLSKEKKSWLNYFSARANYAHGVTDNYGTSTDQLTPIFYQYSGMEQNYWNVGGGVSIPIEDLFDLRGKVKRQKIAIDRAELTKEQAFDQLKQQIIHLYVSIQSSIEVLKRSSEQMALYKGASATAEEAYRNRRTTIAEVAETKVRENAATISFETQRANINEQILILEIISRTEILKK